MAPPKAPTCPKCGARCTDKSGMGYTLAIVETYVSHNPIRFRKGLGIFVESCWESPSQYMSDGESDYSAVCMKCTHKGSLEEFGLKDGDWDWGALED